MVAASPTASAHDIGNTFHTKPSRPGTSQPLSGQDSRPQIAQCRPHLYGDRRHRLLRLQAHAPQLQRHGAVLGTVQAQHRAGQHLCVSRMGVQQQQHVSYGGHKQGVPGHSCVRKKLELYQCSTPTVSLGLGPVMDPGCCPQCNSGSPTTRHPPGSTCRPAAPRVSANASMHSMAHAWGWYLMPAVTHQVPNTVRQALRLLQVLRLAVARQARDHLQPRSVVAPGGRGLT